MEDSNKFTKVIGRRTFKTKTIGGDYCKWSVSVCKNGVSVIEQIILTNDDYDDGFTILTTRFGKKVMYRRMSLKYDTLAVIGEIVCMILNEHGVAPTDIAR